MYKAIACNNKILFTILEYRMLLHPCTHMSVPACLAALCPFCAILPTAIYVYLHYTIYIVYVWMYVQSRTRSRGIAHKLPFLLSLQLHLNSFHLSIHFTAQPFCCILPGCQRQGKRRVGRGVVPRWLTGTWRQHEDNRKSNKLVCICIALMRDCFSA